MPKSRGSCRSRDLLNASVTRSLASSHEAGLSAPFWRISGWVSRFLVGMDIKSVPRSLFYRGGALQPSALTREPSHKTPELQDSILLSRQAAGAVTRRDSSARVRTSYAGLAVPGLAAPDPGRIDGRFTHALRMPSSL